MGGGEIIWLAWNIIALIVAGLHLIIKHISVAQIVGVKRLPAILMRRLITIAQRRIKMKLYLISQDENSGYDTHDSFVVAAKSKNGAKRVLGLSEADSQERYGYGTWAYTYDAIAVTHLGTAKRGTKIGTILGSFNAG
jgi:hypothetical protein